MADITFPKGADIVTAAQRMIGEVAGAGVQLFTEDLMYDNLRRVFDLVFLKRPWEHYLRWSTDALDGVTGKLSTTDPFGDVRQLEDFVAIFRENETKPLPLLNNRVNPYVYTGTQVQYWSSLPVSDTDFVKKRLQFWPKAATGNIVSLVKLNPGQITAVTTIYMDRFLMETGLAWLTLDADATNAGSADTFKGLFDLRFRDLTKRLADQPLQVRGNESIPSVWYEPP